MSVTNKKTSILFQDKNLIGILLFLIGLCGCLAVYNSIMYHSTAVNFLIRQSLWLFIGIIVYFISCNIPFRFYTKYFLLMNLLFWIPLFLVLLAGTTVNGMRGWFILFGSPFPVYIQPAELSKPVYILTLCIAACKIKKEPAKLLVLLGIYILWTFPVILEPDMGTAIIYTFGFFIVYWLGNGRKTYLFLFLGLITIAILIIIFHKPYIINRFIAFLNPSEHSTGAGWHILQFRNTIAKGGLTGAGMGKAVWSSSYLPLSHTDSVFSSLTESLGFIGTTPIVAGFIILFYLAYILGLQGKSKFAALLALSIISLITFQALVHISVNVGLLPTTGVPLPLISYGGSSLVSTMFSFGILLSLANRENTEILDFD